MNIAAECKDAKVIGISGHVRPDGDCVGACLALAMYLAKTNPGADIKVFLENPPVSFNYLKGFDSICDATLEEYNDLVCDAFYVCDCSPDRTGSAEPIYDRAKRKINIDHHVSNSGCGDSYLVRPEVGSVCEVIYHEMDKSIIDRDIAEALYTGIIHDTGVFQYSNTSPDTMVAGGELIKFGFNHTKLIEESFYQKTFLQTQILGKVLLESTLYLNGRCVVGRIDKAVIEAYGATTADFDGIVSQLRNIKGVSCAVFMYEHGDGSYKVSLRTDEKVNAVNVAANYGGGGHMRAAGCTIQGSAEECIQGLIKYIEIELEQSGK